MVKLIVGLKGTGKTKILLDEVNKAVENSNGSVVCIEKGVKLKYDVKHQARLINTMEYDVNNADSLYGMVCGLYVGNFDTTHVFIDSALKMCDNDLKEFDKLISKLNKLSNDNGFECIITSSVEIQSLSAEIKKFIINN